MTITSILLIVVASLAGIALLALLLPRRVRIVRSAVLDAQPESLRELAASNAGYQTFNPYKVNDPNLEIELFGPDSGVGSGFHFKGKDGKGSQTISQLTEDSVHFAIDLGALGKPQQKLTIEPAGPANSQVTWSMDHDLGFNPIFRIFGLFMEKMMGPIFETGLTRLEKAAA